MDALAFDKETFCPVPLKCHDSTAADPSQRSAHERCKAGTRDRGDRASGLRGGMSWVGAIARPEYCPTREFDCTARLAAHKGLFLLVHQARLICEKKFKRV
jgi:hypothetical protein